MSSSATRCWKTGKVGLAQITIGGREWLVGIAPLEERLVMELLRHAEELRATTEDFFDEIASTRPEKENLAVQLVSKKFGAIQAGGLTTMQSRLANSCSRKSRARRS